MSNSSLVNYVQLSPNNSGKRNHKIDTVSIHCMTANASVQTCGNVFSSKSAKASSNYGIDSDGNIGMYVNEDCRSWCTSSSSNDNRAVTIEVANIENCEPYRISDKAYQSLINLLVDICKRNNIPKLLWENNKSLIGQVDKQNMTVHRWFAAKSCPGTWLFEHHSQIANDVNAILEEDNMTQEQFNQMFTVAMNEYRKSLQDNDSGSWSLEGRQYAIDNGLFVGGTKLPDGNPNYMWQDFITREQAATLLKRFSDIK